MMNPTTMALTPAVRHWPDDLRARRRLAAATLAVADVALAIMVDAGVMSQCEVEEAAALARKRASFSGALQELLVAVLGPQHTGFTVEEMRGEVQFRESADGMTDIFEFAPD